jgi:hypothetical protein
LEALCLKILKFSRFIYNVAVGFSLPLGILHVSGMITKVDLIRKERQVKEEKESLSSNCFIPVSFRLNRRKRKYKSIEGSSEAHYV